MNDKQQNGVDPQEGFDGDGGDIWKRSTNAMEAAETEAQQHSSDAIDDATPPAATEAQSPGNRIDRVARSAATSQAAPEGGPEGDPETAPPAQPPAQSPAQPPMPEPPAQPTSMASPELAPQPEPVESQSPGPAQPAEPIAEAAPPPERPAEEPDTTLELGPDTAGGETTAPGQTLTVGRGIRLVAKACECDGLMVEGHLEATAQARTLTVAKGGSFIGNAEVASAEIHGTYEGNLTVSKSLTIHATGSVSGTTRYQEIVIEAGGQISGNTQCLAGAPKSVG